MICPIYKQEVIAALLKSEGPRKMKQLLEYDYDIGQIMRCDQKECIKWEKCRGTTFSLASIKEEEKNE